MASLNRLLGVAAFLAALTGCASGVTNDEPTDTTADTNLPREAEGQRAELLSAFFGLDNALPPLANLVCTGAPGKDGMPVKIRPPASRLQGVCYRLAAHSIFRG
ncbi:MAG: hypothetical protein AAFQ90_05635 [Pseudomonadota bacterium]